MPDADTTAAWLAEGKCARCGKKRKFAPPHATCQKCRTELKENSRAYYAQNAEAVKKANKALKDSWKAQGLCWDCGSEPEPGKARCEDHLQAARDRAKRVYAKKKSGKS